MNTYDIMKDPTVPNDPATVSFGPCNEGCTLSFAADPANGNITVQTNRPVEWIFSREEFAAIVALMNGVTE